MAGVEAVRVLAVLDEAVEGLRYSVRPGVPAYAMVHLAKTRFAAGSYPTLLQQL